MLGESLESLFGCSKVNDDELILLTHNIAKDIENKVQYPGEIKVNAIRQTQAVEFAR